MIEEFLTHLAAQVEFIEQVVRPLHPGGGLHLGSSSELKRGSSAHFLKNSRRRSTFPARPGTKCNHLWAVIRPHAIGSGVTQRAISRHPQISDPLFREARRHFPALFPRTAQRHVSAVPGMCSGKIRHRQPNPVWDSGILIRTHRTIEKEILPGFRDPCRLRDLAPHQLVPDGKAQQDQRRSPIRLKSGFFSALPTSGSERLQVLDQGPFFLWLQPGAELLAAMPFLAIAGFGCIENEKITSCHLSFRRQSQRCDSRKRHCRGRKAFVAPPAA